MSIIATSTKNEVPTSKAKTSVNQEQYDGFITTGVKSRLCDYYESGKKVTGQLKASITKKVTDLVASEYRVKGSRLGHINHAPVEIQATYNQAKELVAGLTWTTNDQEYVISLLAKKVTESK